MEVIRVPATDQLKPVPKLRVRTFFILHDRLNEQSLKDALDSLIRHHWRKLGARLMTRREDGLLEYHLPSTFNEKHTLFNWSSKQHNQSIDAIGLPKVTPPEQGAKLLPHLEAAEDWLSPPEWPLERTLDPPEAPLLYVHFSLFEDGSCITMNSPHVVGDQFGLSNIMKAWLGLMKGEVPPPMVGVKDDYLATAKPYADYPPTDVVRKGRARIRRRGEYPVVLLSFIPDLVLHRKEETHTLFLPLSLIQSMRQRQSKTLTENLGYHPGISENDIITAILLKFTRMHHTSTRTIALSQSINRKSLTQAQLGFITSIHRNPVKTDLRSLFATISTVRGRIPQLQPPTCNAYLHNALHYATSRVVVTPSTPLSEIAYSNRRAVNEALDLKDTEIGRVVTSEQVRRGQPSHICEPFERSFHVTSWTAAWKGLDFSPAFLTKGEVAEERTEMQWDESEKQQQRMASELLVLGSGHPRGGPARFHSTVMCKTSEGYWVDLAAPVKAMNLVKEYLKKDPMLEQL